MSKVIKIESDTIVIGNDDGTMLNVRPSDLNFNPSINDEVSVFRNDTEIIVTKVEKKEDNINSNGININVSNVNGVGSNGIVYQSGSVVNKLVYCLLCFFLGGIGVHKFYAGKIGAGIMYIIFCWTGIPCLIAFVEFIIGLCKHADINGNIVV